jgi:hypothetical protein
VFREDFVEALIPLRALLVAALGAGVAWCWFNNWEWVSIAAPFGLAFVGIVLGDIGTQFLPRRPVAAVRLMEWRILVPAAVSTAAAAAVIIATVELTLPDDPGPSAETKELVGALGVAITGFLTASFISWAGDEKDSRIADWIRSTFQKHYKRTSVAGERVHRFKPQSRGELLVYADPIEGIAGWGRSARISRARGIAEELKSGKSDAPAA